MNNLQILMILLLLSTVIVTAYAIFRIIQIDAKARGMENPSLWGLIFGLNTTNHLLYLFMRNKPLNYKISKEDKEKKDKFKKIAKISMGLLIFTSIIYINIII